MNLLLMYTRQFINRTKLTDLKDEGNTYVEVLTSNPMVSNLISK